MHIKGSQLLQSCDLILESLYAERDEVINSHLKKKKKAVQTRYHKTQYLA